MGIVGSFALLAPLGPSLLVAAAGIAGIGVALAAFGAGSVGAGIGSLIGGFLGGDPIKKFQKFGTMGPSLMMTATAMTQIGKSIEMINANKMTLLAESMDQMAGSAENLASSMFKLSAGDLVNSGIQGVKNIAKGRGNFVGNIVGGSKKKITEGGKSEIAILDGHIVTLTKKFEEEWIPVLVASNKGVGPEVSKGISKVLSATKGP